MFQKSPAYAGVKIYNHLPANIKDLASDTKSFKKALKGDSHDHSFMLWTKFYA
jgi:hypothetical protein